MTAPTQRAYKLGPVLPHVRRAAELMGTRHGIETILGWRASARDKMGHPAGLALDYMCDRATGDRLNADLLANAAALGLAYTIWEQTYFPVGGKPQPMADRGSPTQNHFDHVHAQFRPLGGTGAAVTGADFAGATAGGSLGGAVFDGWAGDLLELGIKLGATAGALALVVSGVRRTVK